MSLVTVYGGDPETCDEFGYGLGSTGGILVLRYVAGAALEFGRNRQDFLHQLYWSPDALMAVTHQSAAEFVDAGEAVWVHRAVSHAIHSKTVGTGRQTCYRICLREVPAGLTGVRIGATAVPTGIGELIARLTTPALDEAEALAIRAELMTGLTGQVRDFTEPDGGAGQGFALQVAQVLAHDPADPASLADWAGRLHCSAKTLQRDFHRQFGQSFTTWRTGLRLRAAQVLLDLHPVAEVAHRVGYSSPSAFIAAFRREYGTTPRRAS